jgi:hypothetical protein
LASGDLPRGDHGELIRELVDGYAFCADRRDAAGIRYLGTFVKHDRAWFSVDANSWSIGQKPDH